MAAAYSDFELIIPNEAERAEAELGSEITIPCRLSTGRHFSGDVTDIKWFKETYLVCHYKNTKVIEGMLYENRVRLLTEEINKGNVSLLIKDFKETDFGDYLCQVTCGDITREITIKVQDVNKLKKQRNKTMALTVGAIGLAALPVVGAAAVVAGATAAAFTAIAAAVAGAAAAVAMIFQIYFFVIPRTWSEQEREKMKISFQLAETCSKQARLRERRHSIDLNPPKMSSK